MSFSDLSSCNPSPHEPTTPGFDPRELADLVARYATDDGEHATPIPRLSLVRISAPTNAIHAMHDPALCIIVQGRKRMAIGSQTLDYGPEKHLLVSVRVPVVAQVVKATREEPYLSLRLDLDPGLLNDLIADAGLCDVQGDLRCGASIAPVTPEVGSAATRLVRLLGAPRERAVLAPLAERELLYRLLFGASGGWLQAIAATEGKVSQVNRAIAWIKQNFRSPFEIATLAREAGLSRSALHHHFRAATAMSPLQYQKRMRLQEARRLMVGDGMDAGTAGFAVGYSSPSQFTREYKRLFGLSPGLDGRRNTHADT